MHREVNPDVGIGATDVLSLRVSVGALVRVLFWRPGDGEQMLALERKATMYKTARGSQIAVRAQPFGGAILILDPCSLVDEIGKFHFDSPVSRSERDFRLFIQPAHWPTLRAFCLAHLNRDDDPVLDSDPGRELREEFNDALKITLRADQYSCVPAGLVVQDEPLVTDNPRAWGYPTARIYRVFEAFITDPRLVQTIMDNCQRVSELDLRALAEKDAALGGQGRANAVLALPVKALRDFYTALPLEQRIGPVIFDAYEIEETVGAVLEGIGIPNYERL
jgi:hypothetical protein